MRAPVGSPPGPAGASSSFLPSPTSSRLGPEPPFPHHSLIHFAPSFSPGRTPAATGTGGVDKQLQGEMFFFLFCFVCLYFAVFVHHAPSGEPFPSVSRSEHTRSHLLLGKKSTTCLWYSKNRSWDLRVCLRAKQGCVKTQMHSRYFNYYMCIYANTNIHACLTMKNTAIALTQRNTPTHIL